MAINLPYPNLDFVPLDRLTAAEVDMLHANTKYLADLWGSTDSNGIILPRHIVRGAYLPVFSLTEVICGSTDDGRIIYGRSYRFPTTPGPSQVTVPHGITGLDIIVGWSGTIYSGDKSTQYPLPAVVDSSAVQYQIQVAKAGNNLSLAATSQLPGGYSGYLTIYYTKTS